MLLGQILRPFMSLRVTGHWPGTGSLLSWGSAYYLRGIDGFQSEATVHTTVTWLVLRVPRKGDSG